MCDMVAKRLYDAGYEVDTCYDGEEAFESVLTENYDLIVLDLNLPGMDGMEILKELRQRNDFPDKKRKWHFGIFTSESWKTGKSGGIDGTCLGCIRG